MKNEPSGQPAPTLGEIVGVLLPQVEKIEEGFQAVRMTLEALLSQFGDAPSNEAAFAQATERPVTDDAQPTPPPTTATVTKSDTVASGPDQSVCATPTEGQLPPTDPVAAEPIPQAMPLPMTDPVAAMPAGTSPMTPVSQQYVEQTLPPTAVANKPTPIAISGGDAGNLSQIVFGAKLAAAPSVAGLSGELLAAMHSNDNDAIGLVGMLMEFRTANTERMAKLLKDVGEAFYRWKPRGDNGTLQALIAWTQALMEEAGLKNRIDIVQIGDRYDMQRHNAKERGIEVSDVFGWVVLRDNGKVYSKANVSVK